QVADEDVDGVRAAFVRGGPDVGEDLVPGQYPAGVVGKVFEERVFPGGELDRFASPPHVMARRIDLQVADGEDPAAAVAGAAEEAADAGQQLGELERLGQVVVR